MLAAGHAAAVNAATELGWQPIGHNAPGGQPPRFRFGLHALPSMPQLHVHCISQDLDSECTKNKKHWNSFATAFFKDLGNVIVELEGGNVTRLDWPEKDMSDLINGPLRCHRCSVKLANMPALKRHIRECPSHPPGTLLADLLGGMG